MLSPPGRQTPCAISFEHHWHQRAPIARSTINIDTIAIMDRVLFSRVAVDDQVWMCLGMLQETLANPEHVLFSLIHQGNTGANAGVDKKLRARLVEQRQRVDPAQMLLRHGCPCRFMHNGRAILWRAADAVGRQCFSAPDTLLQVVKRHGEMRIFSWEFFQKPRKHTVMVALEARPVAPIGLPLHEAVDHATAVRTTIHIVAYKDDLGLCPAITFDQFESALQLFGLSVDVTNSVDGLGHKKRLSFIFGQGARARYK